MCSLVYALIALMVWSISGLYFIRDSDAFFLLHILDVSPVDFSNSLIHRLYSFQEFSKWAYIVLLSLSTLLSLLFVVICLLFVCCLFVGLLVAPLFMIWYFSQFIMVMIVYLFVALRVTSLVFSNFSSEVRTCCIDSPVSLDRCPVDVRTCHFFIMTPLRLLSWWFAIKIKWKNSTLTGMSVYRSHLTIWRCICTYPCIILSKIKDNRATPPRATLDYPLFEIIYGGVLDGRLVDCLNTIYFFKIIKSNNKTATSNSVGKNEAKPYCNQLPCKTIACKNPKIKATIINLFVVIFVKKSKN